MGAHCAADARAGATRSARVGDGGCDRSSWGPGNGHGWFRKLARWSLDFVSDAFARSRRFRILCEVDDYNRECLALVADTSLPGVRVMRELTELIGIRGKLHTVVTCNGTDLTSSAILRWSQKRWVEWYYIALGKPMQNKQWPSTTVLMRNNAVRLYPAGVTSIRSGVQMPIGI